MTYFSEHLDHVYEHLSLVLNEITDFILQTDGVTKI